MNNKLNFFRPACSCLLFFLLTLIVLACGGGGGGGGTSTGDPVAVAPIADAGPDQTVVANSLVTLDGSASIDLTGRTLTYAWTITSKPNGSLATLSNSTSSRPAFTADVAGSYVISLVVTNGTATSNPDTVTIITGTFQPTPSPTPPLSQSVAYQIDYAHSGRAVFAGSLSFPGSATWSVTLNGEVSYPLIANGMVFVTTADFLDEAGYNSSLYALNAQTGSVVWGPIDITSYVGWLVWSSHAYDQGKVFVINYYGLLRSFNAATGQAIWRTQLPSQYAFISPPTAVNGIVYVGGGDRSGGIVYAVDELNGNVLWTAGVANGDVSSPTVSSGGVFVTCPSHAYKFAPLTGSSLWHYSGGGSGAGRSKTTAYANGQLYMRDEYNPVSLILDAATGTLTGNFTATPIPAFSAQTGFFLSAGTLKGIDLSSNNVLWSFTGDGALVSAPIVINNNVIVGSSSGKVYAVDATTGAQIWSGNAGSPIPTPYEQNVSFPLTGFGAGDGYLIVPAGGYRLTAWKISGP